MKKIRAAVVGYGNIGKYTIEALEASDDFEIAGIVRRKGAEKKERTNETNCNSAFGASGLRLHCSGCNCLRN